MQKALIAAAFFSSAWINFAATTNSAERGKWTSVTPTNVDLKNELDCDNYGSITMAADPMRPSDLYTQFHCQGVWKSVDYGLTWTGPINVGVGGVGVNGAGGLAIARGPDGQPPILYSAGIRGSGIGFWRSTDGGVSWTRHRVAPSRDRQDFYPPVVNPYDPEHLLMNGHRTSLMVQSRDGGRTWTEVPIAPGMRRGNGTAMSFFIDTGDAATTSKTWLWTAEGSDGSVGTWRTADGGNSWTRVDGNEHPHGQMQIYQPDASGVVFMAGFHSSRGHGVLRSTDFGQTWRHVGANTEQAIVFGTPKTVYASFAWACASCDVDPNMQSAPAPGLTDWQRLPRPPEMAIGAAQTATIFDGKNYIIVSANWKGGLWRLVE